MKCELPAYAFLGLPIQPDLERVVADFAVIGVPYGSPYRPELLFNDSCNAPRVTRDRSRRYSDHISHHDFDIGGTLLGETNARVVDCGDLRPVLDGEQNADLTEEAVNCLLLRGVVPIMLGGDDSVPIPCARAFRGFSSINVLQIDAHIDFRDEVHGNRNGYSSPMRRIREMPWIARMVQVGARGTGSARPSDLQDALAAGNLIVPAAEIHARGVAVALEHVQDDAPWLISLDVDGLDPSIAPGTGAPIPGGLSFEQARLLVRHVCSTCRLAGFVVTEHFPKLDVRDSTALVVIRLLVNAIGFAARRRSAEGLLLAQRTHAGGAFS